MNENRAPLTIMITLDEAQRMVPGKILLCNEEIYRTESSLVGFAYLSSDTTIESQVVFLEEAKKLVEKMADDLVNGRCCPTIVFPFLP